MTGLFLVAGTTLESSRRLVPVPQLRASMILVMGTGDPTAPYAGGRLTRRGLSGQILKRRAVKHGELPGEDIVAGAEEVVADWAVANGITVSGITATGSIARPLIEELPMAPGDLPVTRKTWTRPGCHPATLYRIDGGGHGWPGGPQFMPARVIGPIAKHLDATGLLLDMAERETAIAFGHPALDRGERSPEGGRISPRGEPAAAPARDLARGLLPRDPVQQDELLDGEGDHQVEEDRGVADVAAVLAGDVAGHQVVVAQVGGQRQDPEHGGQPCPLAQQLAVLAATPAPSAPGPRRTPPR